MIMSFIQRSSISLVSFSLIVSLVVPAGLLTIPREARAQAGTASACAAAFAAATAAAAPGTVQEALGVPKANLGDFFSQIFSGGSVNTQTLNTCLLKPLGQAIVITLIRNIGASVVNWVNTGFEGKPLFVTDLEGTLLDAADQTIGRFIEGTELSFLCNDFSFQIRLELAMKYSQPFREQIRCTVSEIGDNINNFAENNGGAGWNNWLELTTRPSNGIYGAYLIAESELAQRAAREVGLKEKKITITEGFLNFDTCDEWETQADVQARVLAATNGSLVNPSAASAPAFGANLANTLPTFSDTGSNGFSAGVSSQGVFEQELNTYALTNTGINTNPGSIAEFAGNFNTKPQCKPGKMTTKTPGKIISSKLSSVLGQGEIQTAVADEIDEVIAATLNQLAQKAISGTSGLLGLSKKRSASAPTYLDRYRAQYYGITLPASADVGASSELDDYQLSSYQEAQALFNDPSDLSIRSINETASAAVAAGSTQQSQQQDALSAQYGGSNSATVNAALLKSASQSSGTNPGGAVDGVTQTNNYLKGSATYETDANPWWEVNLGQTKNVKEVRIWKVSDKPASDTLGDFIITAKTDAGEVWSSSAINGDQSANPIIVQVNKNASAIRIQKSGGAEECQEYYYRGYRDAFDCYKPLELAEVEVIEVIQAASTVGTATPSTPTSGSGSSQTSTQNDPDSPVTVANYSGTTPSNGSFQANISITSPANRSVASVDVSLESSTGQLTAFSQVFSQATIGVKQDGMTRNFNPGSNGTMTFTGMATGPSHNAQIILSGTFKALPSGSSYTIRITAKDETGATLSTGTARIDIL